MVCMLRFRPARVSIYTLGPRNEIYSLESGSIGEESKVTLKIQRCGRFESSKEKPKNPMVDAVAILLKDFFTVYFSTITDVG